MPDQDFSAEFSALIARHREIIIAMLESNQFSPMTASDGATVARVAEELMLRTRIIAWQPTNRDEAYRKLEHLVQALAAGAPIDRMSVDIAVKTVESFISRR
ncbi:hypothetical protein DEM27_24490 [Metarhizobium album]|uniref:Uncharacterized protein n=1 Tax=Metarhizobium album TaxID=2182425 RepID=A0A2U2DK56_9HYPH|nr:hypothetical protein [Rhizobium album]PWE53699.1 hypothetical protein DEM27_24490 [Rhizobium album]